MAIVKMILTNGFEPDLRVYKEAKYLISKGHKVEIICWDREARYKDKPNEIIEVIVNDPVAENEEIYKEYGYKTTDFDNINNIDCAVVAVAHKKYKQIEWTSMEHMFNNNGQKVMIDIKSIYNQKQLENNGFLYWSL